MFVDRFKATNFRCFDTIEAEFSRNLNLIHGNNGAGKSNFLEGVHYALQGTGIRTKKDFQLLKHEAGFIRTEADIYTQDMNKNIAVSWQRESGKKITINGLENQNTSTLFEISNVVIMTPSTPELVKGGPENRRKFIDRIHAKENPSYLSILHRYSLSYRSRNLLLKRKFSEPKDKQLFETLTHTLVNLSKIIQKERTKTIEQMQETFNSICTELNLKSLQCIQLQYSPVQLDFDYYSTTKQELARGVSLIGAHLDRIQIKRDKKSLRIYGSEGEQKITAFVLKLCEFHFLELQTKNIPVVLLDDFQSELDADNFQCMLSFLRPKAQILLTSLYPSLVDTPDRLFHLKEQALHGTN